MIIDHRVHPADVGGTTVATHVRDLGQGPAEIDGDHHLGGRASGVIGDDHDQPVSTTERVRLRGVSGSRPKASARATATRCTVTSCDQGVAVVGDPGRSGGGDVVREARWRLAEHPDRTAGGGDRDRSVPVVHRRVGLRPAGGGLPELQRRLVRQPHGPPAAEEGALLGRGPGRIERGGDRLGRRIGQSVLVAAPGRTEEQQGAGGESGLDHRLLVGEGEVDDPVGQLGGRRVEVAEHHGGRHPTGHGAQLIEHLGGGARAGQGDDPVVAPVGRDLRGGEGIGLAESGGLAPSGGHLTDEPGGAAADQGDPLAGRTQGARHGAATSTARRQQSGWEAISASTKVMLCSPKCLRLFVLLPKHADMNISCRL